MTSAFLHNCLTQDDYKCFEEIHRPPTDWRTIADELAVEGASDAFCSEHSEYSCANCYRNYDELLRLRAALSAYEKAKGRDVTEGGEALVPIHYSESPSPVAQKLPVPESERLDAAGRAAYHAETGDCPDLEREAKKAVRE